MAFRTLRLKFALVATLTWHAMAGAQTVPTLSFRDFFKMPVGPGGLEISTTLEQSNGQRVRLTGYMVQQDFPAPGAFMLTPRPVQMSENADGDADDLPPAMVLVKLDESHREWVLAHQRGLIEVDGVLDVGREEGANGRVSWVRLQLAPDALRAMNLFEVASYLHARAHQH